MQKWGQSGLRRGSEREFESELRAEVAAYFPRLRDYVAKMAEKQYGLLIWLSGPRRWAARPGDSPPQAGASKVPSSAKERACERLTTASDSFKKKLVRPVVNRPRFEPSKETLTEE